MTVYNDQISAYINSLFIPSDPLLEKIMQDSAQKGLPAITIKPEEGRFLQFLVRASGARRALEIGTLGGYSGAWICRGLLPGGKLVTLEKSPRHAEIAQEHFEQLGLAKVAEIRVGDAHQLLQKAQVEQPYDFIFIDAEKPGYPDYFEWAVNFLPIGGVLAAHNAFRKGSVAGLAPDDDYSETMRKFNKRVSAEPRLLSTIFPAGDGMLVGVKIS